jgi:hypothetical protein
MRPNVGDMVSYEDRKSFGTLVSIDSITDWAHIEWDWTRTDKEVPSHCKMYHLIAVGVY